VLKGGVDGDYQKTGVLEIVNKSHRPDGVVTEIGGNDEIFWLVVSMVVGHEKTCLD
jgi:hypothetical protein